MAPKPKKTHSRRPLWLKRLSWRTFPRGPRGLYCYLAAFKTGQCWLYNYRLANTFDVTKRTIQLWLSYLTKMSLIHVYWIGGKHRRIVVHHYRSSSQWLISAALPKPKKKYRKHKLVAAGNYPWAHLTPAQFEARKQVLLRQLKGAKNCAL